MIAGRDDISDVDLTAPTVGQVLLTVDGALSEERIGNIATVGDVNGDDVDDFLLGAYTSTPWGSTIAVPGAAYVVFGGTTGEVDAADLGSKGFTIVGPTRQRDRLGISVSGLGDVDGDGLADLLVGADGVNNATTGPRSGGAAVVFGSADLDRVYTDPTATNGQAVFTCEGLSGDPATCTSPVRRGYWIDGAVNNDSTGYSVAGIGDVDGDGVPDLALGAYGFDPANPAGGTFSGAGAVYVLYGDPDATAVSLASLDAAAGYRIDGSAAGDRFGRQVGALGDLDGNGTTDFAVGADFAARPSSQQGEVTLALMGQLDTELTLSGPGEATTGDDVTYTASLRKPAGDQAPVSDGTVAFTLAGAPVAGCEAVALDAGVATCTFASDDEISGDVVASYSGTPALATAASNAVALSYEQIDTSIELDASDDAPQTGQVVQILAAVTDAEGGAVADGTVRFTSDGSPISGCGAVALAGDGSASCTTSWKAIDSVDIAATYSGTVRYAASASTSSIVDVGSNAAIYTLDAKGTFGSKGAIVAGIVLGEARTATGTVTVRNGDVVLGTTTLTNGWFSIPLGTTAVYPRYKSLTVEYGGDARHRPASATAEVSISKASPKVAISVTPTTLRAHVTRAVVSVTVTATGTVPRGTVKVQLDGRTLTTTATLDASGRARIVLPIMAVKGNRSLRIQYAGSTTVGVGYSATTRIVVR